MRIQPLTFLFCFTVAQAVAQFNPVKQAQAKFARSKWREGRELLDKAIRKDSLKLPARYVYSKLFLNKRFDNYSIDSAYLFAQQANTLWNNLSAREKERLKKFPIDSITLFELNNTIDSLAFAFAKDEDTEASYLHFLKIHSKSPHRELAIELRDEAAFVMALKQNTHLAFQEFLSKYPMGHRAVEARQRFEKLLFESATRHSTLAEFKQFVVDQPTSPHANEAISKIFELETLDGEMMSFERFIRQYPKTSSAKRAAALLIHVLPESTRSNMNDSLGKIYPLTDWLPVHLQTSWGFINNKGIVSLTGLPELNETLLCEPLQTDFILTTENIVARNGSVIQTGKFESAKDIGAGFILAKQDGHGQLVHKSGWALAIRDIQSAHVVDQRFIALKRNNRWALYSLTGKALTEFVFQSIEPANQFTLFNRAGKTLLVNNSQILNFTKGQYQPMVADEIKPMGNKFWLRNGALEQVMDAQLNVTIPYARQNISYSALGLILKQNNSTRLPEWLPNHPSNVESVTIAEPWAIIRVTGEKPSLHHIPSKKIVELQADSIWFDQTLVLAKRGDTTTVRLPNQQVISLPKGERISVRQSRDSALFILTRDKTKTRVFDAQSLKELFKTEFYPEPILHNIFLFENQGKKGLLDNQGKTILPATYGAILFNQGTFTLLKGNLFGAFNPITKKIIKPVYESNLRAIGTNFFVALKKSKWGFLSDDGKPLSAFEFDDAQPWSDSIALVKKSERQWLIKIVSQKILMDSIEGIHRLNQEEGVSVSVIERKGRYGLMNHAGKMLIQPTLEELIPWEMNNKSILLALTILNPENRQITFYSLNGKIIHTFSAPKELAYKFLCD